jgi:phosphatidylglycerophosphatase GEP4
LALKSFDKLPVPVQIPSPLQPNIKGLVLDKDNCFAQDHDDKVWPEYEEIWNKLKAAYPKEHILIVSNSAGTNDDINYVQATKLEENTGITVLRHPTKKPGCGNEILQYFDNFNIKPNEIAVVGDRLFTDMLMANMMGSWGIWLSDGVEQSQKLFPKLERQLYGNLVTTKAENPFVPPTPSN